MSTPAETDPYITIYTDFGAFTALWGEAGMSEEQQHESLMEHLKAYMSDTKLRGRAPIGLADDSTVFLHFDDVRAVKCKAVFGPE